MFAARKGALHVSVGEVHGYHGVAGRGRHHLGFQGVLQQHLKLMSVGQTLVNTWVSCRCRLVKALGELWSGVQKA